MNIKSTHHIINGLIVPKNLGVPIYQQPEKVTQKFFNTLTSSSKNKLEFIDTFIGKLNDEAQIDINLNFVINLFKKSELLNKKALPVIDKNPLAAVHEIKNALEKESFSLKKLLDFLNPNLNLKEISLTQPITNTTNKANARIKIPLLDFLGLINSINSPKKFSHNVKNIVASKNISVESRTKLLEKLQTRSSKVLDTPEALNPACNKISSEDIGLKYFEPSEIISLVTYAEKKQQTINIADSKFLYNRLKENATTKEIMKLFQSTSMIRDNFVEFTSYMQKKTQSNPEKTKFQDLLKEYRKLIKSGDISFKAFFESINKTPLTKNLKTSPTSVPKSSPEFYSYLMTLSDNKNIFIKTFISRLKIAEQNDVNLKYVVGIFKKSNLIPENLYKRIEKNPAAAIKSIEQALRREDFIITKLLRRLNPIATKTHYPPSLLKIPPYKNKKCIITS